MVCDNHQHTGEVNKQFLTAPVKTAVDKYQLVPEFLKVRGLVKEHLDSFNYFVTTGIKKIVAANSTINSGINPTNVYLRYEDVRIGLPSEVVDGVTESLNPQTCRLSDITYAAPILVNIKYCNGNAIKGQKPVEYKKSNVVIGRLPIMLRSCRCILYEKDEVALENLGECPLDPGGYFVVNGNEKVLLIQEQLSKNRIIIERDKNKFIQASIMSSTEASKIKTTITMERENIVLFLSSFTTKVPIMVVFKAMGMESDQEVVQMLGRDPIYATLLMPSIEECSKNGIYTQYQALEFLEKKLRWQSDKESGALRILRHVFLSNIQVHDNSLRPKCIFVAVMIRRMMDAFLNKVALDDKDYVGNKRLELSGQLISYMFEDLFKTTNSKARESIDKKLSKGGGRFDISQEIVASYITEGLVRALSTGNWDIKRFKMHKKGVSQVLNRLSFIGAVGFMTKIQPQFEKSMKVSGPRALQPSQWGMLCPCDTPEGEGCGLVKNLALMAHVTTDEDEGPIATLCRVLGVLGMEQLSGEDLHNPSSYLILLNGSIIGKHNRAQKFVTVMRKLRRAGKIGEFVSIHIDEKQLCVYIASDGGRICRPLVIADKGVSRIKEYHMRQLKDGTRSFASFSQEGLIEYLDVHEENNALIALYEGETTEETTHIEIDPFTILGVCAGLIPFPHHNQSPRNTYQCAMGKQAMGSIAYNQLSRMDTLLYLLVYPQRPLLTTRTIELVGFDKLGAGQNATVAVMSYSGYDIEDAIVMNKSSLDRGFGRCIVMKRLTTTFQKYKNGQDQFCRPSRTDLDPKKQILDNDGIATPGGILRPHDTYFTKYVPVSGQFEFRQQRYDARAEEAVVDRVALCTDKKNSCLKVKIMTRQTRRPEVGDKFSSRHGQKGVCGTIIQQEDFPFSERGICPDLIMNPHGFPSRMTVGKMIELLGSKAGVACGKFHYGSAFGEPSGHAHKVEAMSETLVKHGFCYSGKDFLYSGITGTPLQAYIFMGPIYYQKLKHMVADKMHARGMGPREMISRQPTEGRSRNGGLRIGEMERDCMIAYGAANLTYERLMLSSDPFEAQVCRKCGLLGYINHQSKTKFCSKCKNGDNISSMRLPYSCKLLFQELQSMNIVPLVTLADA
ncbi:nuclear RNA polymerase C2 [Artemisia annua]|uniref:DNA-directed RNA polymerase subunit beta n=1 Tax=Artemisia annua TaxID=35608 RepID=A0A2U1LPI2_ARTAN|nr:nuclear RNA polymerase C2 [Artemisia annua]